MPDVRKLFGELFAYVLLFEQTLLEGKSQPTHQQVHDQITKLLDEQVTAAEREGISDEDNQDARFAVIAWIDETILKQSTWKDRHLWEASPLQLEYFNTWNAGVELFDRLGRLHPEQKELREVYYLCLSLGFRGQYSNDERKVIQILRDQAPYLLRPVEELRASDKLTPQPYDISAPEGKPPWSPWIRRLVYAGLWALVGIPLVLFVVLRMMPVEPPVGGVVVQPIGGIPDVSSIQKAIEEKLKPYEEKCANVSIDRLDPQRHTVRLRGRAESETQRADIRQDVQNVSGGWGVDDTLEIIPRPYCEVLEVLQPFKSPALKVSLNKTTADSRPTYYAGENLVINVTTPSNFQIYLYVDYFSSQANVSHLFPNDFEKMRLFAPDTSYTVGDPERVGIYIKPPPGLELITVITSRSQLFPTERPFTESTESYLKELRQALSHETSKADTAAVFYLFMNQSQ